MTTGTIDSSLKARIRGGAIFGAIVLGALYLGGLAFILLMGAATAIGISEWTGMMKVEQKYRLPFMFFGVLYIAVSCATMIWLRIFAPYGLYNMLTLLLIVWASDISAYFSGRAIGGPKLAPKISPKKTWAGFIGSSVGAGIVAGGLACPATLAKFHVATIGHFSPAAYALTGSVLAMCGQAGDLLISFFKRRIGIKDTGTIIPGHGGVLDRIDALLLVALIFGMIARFAP
ncbi:MAG: phosphatidate cytidylyltransferase [Alphaproteobacteria bacterium]|nr:phosphatidate cytidylyltransferase [Alphaproteobacteria bacterium]